MAQVVEDEQQVGDHQRHVGQPERVGIGLAERLDGADQVVAEEADGAAGKRRQALDRGELEAGEALGDRRVGVGRLGSSPPSESVSTPSLQRSTERGRKPTKE